MIDNLPDIFNAKPAGRDKWRCRCPAHAGQSTGSLAIRRGDGGAWLLHCFGGCDTESVLAAVGLTFKDILPERDYDRASPRRLQFSAADGLRALDFEGQIIAQAAVIISRGGTLSPEDAERVVTASKRISAIRSELERAGDWLWRQRRQHEAEEFVTRTSARAAWAQGKDANAIHAAIERKAQRNADAVQLPPDTTPQQHLNREYHKIWNNF
jgi:hypothetical protein